MDSENQEVSIKVQGGWLTFEQLDLGIYTSQVRAFASVETWQQAVWVCYRLEGLGFDIDSVKLEDVWWIEAFQVSFYG